MEENAPEFRQVESMSYAEASAELESILRMMQSDKCDIDRLAAYTRRATELLKACRSRLTATEQELRSILDQLSE